MLLLLMLLLGDGAVAVEAPRGSQITFIALQNWLPVRLAVYTFWSLLLLLLMLLLGAVALAVAVAFAFAVAVAVTDTF